MQGFLRDERGTTRVAVAIGLVVVAVLAAAAVPMVMSQARNAQDSRARSALTDLAKEVEACRLGADTYRDCDEPRELESDASGRWGDDSGDSGVVTTQSTETAFVAYAVSGNGSRMYVWSSRDSQPSKHVCSHVSVKHLQREDCDGPAW